MYIITKIQLIENVVVENEIGFTEDVLIANQINENYDLSLGKFLGEFRTKLELGEMSLNDFFVDEFTFVNQARIQTNYSEENVEKYKEIKTLKDLQ